MKIIKKWTYEEESNLRIWFINQKMTAKEIAEITGRTECSVENRLYRLNIKKEERVPWIPAEDNFLIKNYKKFRLSYLAERLGRSPGSVRNRIRNLKLTLGD